mmetsp:Transcript_2034/g.5373  ORF Transcript_2034/g.5373 Transcript_2034/m.5373 type:complete len:215 (-) Transcript_2034:404-1048(-)
METASSSPPLSRRTPPSDSASAYGGSHRRCRSVSVSQTAIPSLRCRWASWKNCSDHWMCSLTSGLRRRSRHIGSSSATSGSSGEWLGRLPSPPPSSDRGTGTTPRSVSIRRLMQFRPVNTAKTDRAFPSASLARTSRRASGGKRDSVADGGGTALLRLGSRGPFPRRVFNWEGIKHEPVGAIALAAPRFRVLLWYSSAITTAFFPYWTASTIVS